MVQLSAAPINITNANADDVFIYIERLVYAISSMQQKENAIADYAPDINSERSYLGACPEPVERSY